MRILLISVILIMITSSCKPQAEVKNKPVGYDLQQPEKFSLTESLLEVSGITFRNGQNDTIFAVQDEEGRLFRTAWGSKEQKNVSFASSGDYEDLAIKGDRIFILRSGGTIYSFAVSEATDDQVSNVKEHTDLLPSGEYEGMYYDGVSDRLIVLCKSCKTDKKTKTLTGYALRLDGEQLIPGETIKVNYESLAGTKDFKGSLKPSAIARHPITSQWYVVSSVNKRLLLLNETWEIQDTYPLSSKIFNQPEGIAFDKDGNLYISNEGDEISQGNILKFNYKP